MQSYKQVSNERVLYERIFLSVLFTSAFICRRDFGAFFSFTVCLCGIYVTYYSFVNYQFWPYRIELRVAVNFVGVQLC